MLSRRQLQQISARLLEEVQSRLALGSMSVGILGDIQSLECLLEKGIEVGFTCTQAAWAWADTIVCGRAQLFINRRLS